MSWLVWVGLLYFPACRSTLRPQRQLRKAPGKPNEKQENHQELTKKSETTPKIHHTRKAKIYHHPQRNPSKQESQPQTYIMKPNIYKWAKFRMAAFLGVLNPTTYPQNH